MMDQQQLHPDTRTAASLAVDGSLPQLRHRHHKYPGGLGSAPEQSDVAKQAYRSTLMVLAACTGWVAASSGAILVNKHIMVDLKFKYPAAVAAFGMLGTSVACYLAVRVFKLVRLTAVITPRFFVSSILPTGFFMAWTFLAGNLSYLYLTVAFVQMLKALTPVTTMVCGFIFKLERPSAPLVASICLITAGVMGASFGEVNFNLVGVLSMLSSVAAEGLRLVLAQVLVARKQMQSLEALLYLAPACSFWLLLFVAYFELPKMVAGGALQVVVQAPFSFLVSSCIGFGVNAMAMAVISLASALTLKVLGICKDLGLVMVGVLLFGEKVSKLQLAGYMVSLLGFIWYHQLKSAPAPNKA